MLVIWKGKRVLGSILGVTNVETIESRTLYLFKLINVGSFSSNTIRGFIGSSRKVINASLRVP